MVGLKLLNNSSSVYQNNIDTFSSFKFKDKMKINNRIILAPMTTWSGNKDFTVSDQEIEYYRIRVGGVGMVITGCSHVSPNGIGFENEFAAYDDKFLPSLKKLANISKSQKAPAILQIFHAGSKGLSHLTPDGKVVSASDIEIKETNSNHRLISQKLTNDEIEEIIYDFGEATRRAIEAGFDGVELHGAHGFLIQNFLSPNTNKRTDQWGGDFEKRSKFPIEIIKEVKKVIQKNARPEFILGYRATLEESTENGLTLKDSLRLIEKLLYEKIDYLHISLPDAINSYSKDKNFKKPIIEEVTEVTSNKIPVMVAGAIYNSSQVEALLNKGVDLVSVGHSIIANPYWVENIKKGTEYKNKDYIDSSQIKKLKLPDCLWEQIRNSNSWFKIK